MKRKLLLAVLTVGLFSVNSCTQSVLGTDVEQELLVQKNELASKACVMNWQTKTGNVIWGTVNKSFSVVSSRSGQIYIVNDNNDNSGSNGNIILLLR